MSRGWAKVAADLAAADAAKAAELFPVYKLDLKKEHLFTPEGKLTALPLYGFHARRLGEQGGTESRVEYTTEWEAVSRGLDALLQLAEARRTGWGYTMTVEPVRYFDQKPALGWSEFSAQFAEWGYGEQAAEMWRRLTGKEPR